MPALYDLVEHILDPDEKVLTLSPADGPFELAATRHGRQLVTCGLIEDSDGQYTVDLADLDEKLSHRKGSVVHPLSSPQPDGSRMERR